MGGNDRLHAAAIVVAALEYAERSWPVVPLFMPVGKACSCGKPDCSNVGKHPRAEHGFKSASTAPSTIRRAFQKPSNVGIATGAKAGFWALDVDGAEGKASLKRLLEQHGPLPNTVESRTGSGGRHLLFRYPSGRTVKNSVKKLAPGLDVRSDGGGIVAPPSRHVSGRIYQWVDGRAPGDIEVAEAPAWLYEAIDAADRPRRAPVSPPQVDAAAAVVSATTVYAETALNGEVLAVMRAPQGTRNSTLYTAALKLGGLVGAGLLDQRLVESELSKAALACGLADEEIAKTLQSGLATGIASPRSLDSLQSVQDARRRVANQDAQAGRRRRLLDTPVAQEWLAGLCLTQETVEHFGFGLDRPYESTKTGKVYADALTFPLRAADGSQLSIICKADIPGLTRFPKAAWWAAAKNDATFYAEAQTEQPRVVVCDMPDLWLLWQELRDGAAVPGVQMIASTGTHTTPAEWAQAAFWDSWSEIYVATAADARGERIAQLVHRCAGKPVHRLAPPKETWREAFMQGAGADDFGAALLEAKPIGEQLVADDNGPGRRAYKPLDIGRAFHNGHLYYPVDTLLSEIEVDKDGIVREVQRVETVVVRSDGQLLHAVEMPAPKGTPLDKRVMRLNDGTLIDSVPKAPAKPSWSWPAIEAWLATKKEGRRVVHRPLSAILADVRQNLLRQVWLPYEEDYAVLALAVVASYGQAVFQAVPLILLCGEPGSGKSTAGIAMAALSINGDVAGQMNAAAAARLIHETKGLIVLDDLEAIGGTRAGKDQGAGNDLIQWLKVSYNRDTATKVWVDASRGFKVERLNGFGIKVINNTTGVDNILGSRMIRIQTRKMPSKVIQDRERTVKVPSPDEAQRLRDELHAWVFDHVGVIDQVYREVCPSASERSEEIAAPLRVIARIAGDPEVMEQLERALARTKKATFNPDDPVEILKEAAVILAQQGYREISPTHVIMEMKRLVDAFFGQTNKTEVPEFQQPEWVGRMLRLRDIVDSSTEGRRKRFYGKNLRIYPFSQHFLVDVLEEGAAVPEKEPTAFCMGCSACPYRSHGCEMMAVRLEEEQRRQAVRH